MLWKHKKTLPTGQQVFRYSERDREHGKRMMILGMIIFPIWIWTQVSLELPIF